MEKKYLSEALKKKTNNIYDVEEILERVRALHV